MKLGIRGQGAGAIATVVAVIGVMITAWIGVHVLANVEGGMPSLDTDDNENTLSYAENAFSSIQKTGWGGYPLIGVVVIILVAALIIGLMIRFGGGV